MRQMTIHLLKPGKGTIVTYSGVLVCADCHQVLVHARWERDVLDLGYVVFERGDHFYEYYFFDRWFTIFEVRAQGGGLKGWYCNVARPAECVGDVIISEDLEIDLFVSPDRRRLLTLDREEFEARGFAVSAPGLYTAALVGIEQLRSMALAGMAPFDAVC